MSKLDQLYARRDRAAEKLNAAKANYRATDAAIKEWAKSQIMTALDRNGISPGKSVVRMKVRIVRGNRITFEDRECLLLSIQSAQPPGYLGYIKNGTDFCWWVRALWRNVRKDGRPGALWDSFLMHGETPADIAAQIKHVRDLP